MNRIDEVFKRLKAAGKKAFIPYITAGDPDLDTTEKIVVSLANAGADIIELGIPFSDPLADGPTIQRAIKRSLDKGATVKKILNLVKKIRKHVQTPLVFMTYYNIIYNYGVESFIKDAKASGADGVIVPDLPMEEAAELSARSREKNFDIIMLTAPTTPPARFERIAKMSKGFVYYVSLTGVTGARKNVSGELKNDVRKLKGLTSRPVCVGFGVSKPAHARYVAEFADGVIVGSAIISIIERNLGNKKGLPAKVERFAKSIARAVHCG